MASIRVLQLTGNLLFRTVLVLIAASICSQELQLPYTVYTSRSSAGILDSLVSTKNSAANATVAAVQWGNLNFTPNTRLPQYDSKLAPWQLAGVSQSPAHMMIGTPSLSTTLVCNPVGKH